MTKGGLEAAGCSYGRLRRGRQDTTFRTPDNCCLLCDGRALTRHVHACVCVRVCAYVCVCAQSNVYVWSITLCSCRLCVQLCDSTCVRRARGAAGIASRLAPCTTAATAWGRGLGYIDGGYKTHVERVGGTKVQPKKTPFFKESSMKQQKEQADVAPRGGVHLKPLHHP